MHKLAFILSLILLLTACGAPAPVMVQPSPTATETLQPSATPTLEPSPTSTPEPACAGAECPTATPDSPFEFVLPTPGGESVSVWRPPLYPVPWALSPVDHFYFTRPIAADEINWPLEDYRYGGIFSGTDMVHTGIDIPANYGTDVLAAGPGTVVWAGWGLYSGVSANKKDPYGQAIVIRHDFGYNGENLFTVYAHLSKIDVERGQWVASGETIGEVGRTGFTTGPHLHFEVRNGTNDYFSTSNPELWLAPPQGWGVLVGRVRNSYGYLLPDAEVIVDAIDGSRRWRVRTYGPESVHPDAYYNENMVLSDLPAGKYTVTVVYLGSYVDYEIEIYPGRVTYFSFKGNKGYFVDTPLPPGVAELTPTVKP